MGCSVENRLTKKPQPPHSLSLFITLFRSMKGFKRVSSRKSVIKKRRRSATKSLRQIRRMQKTTNLLIPRASFQREIRSILSSYAVDRISTTALYSIQLSAEDHLIDLFSSAVLAAIHAGRVTLFPSDMLLTLRLRR